METVLHALGVSKFFYHTIAESHKLQRKRFPALPEDKVVKSTPLINPLFDERSIFRRVPTCFIGGRRHRSRSGGDITTRLIFGNPEVLPKLNGGPAYKATDDSPAYLDRPVEDPRGAGPPNTDPVLISGSWQRIYLSDSPLSIDCAVFTPGCALLSHDCLDSGDVEEDNSSADPSAPDPTHGAPAPTS
ncbi:hypothetical protein LTR53_007279 [Teratosphaeriaceae sp. CCFEE 6253]|nr:hypothetical protein LTR53_007279 [Teratosphaeriaceae sp. CCFEE 6253]